MKTVFVLHHIYDRDGSDEVKLIGVFRTREDADHAVGELINKDGFSSYPDGFEITEYELDRIWWSDGFITQI